MQQGQRPEANQPGQRLGNGNKTDEAQKGRVKVVPSNGKVVPPFQGFVRIKSDPQGCARASLALGWLVTGLWPEGLTAGAPPRRNSKFRTRSKVQHMLRRLPLVRC